jgi:hypothetical protein
VSLFHVLHFSFFSADTSKIKDPYATLLSAIATSKDAMVKLVVSAHSPALTQKLSLLCEGMHVWRTAYALAMRADAQNMRSSVPQPRSHASALRSKHADHSL